MIDDDDDDANLEYGFRILLGEEHVTTITVDCDDDVEDDNNDDGCLSDRQDSNVALTLLDEKNSINNKNSVTQLKKQQPIYHIDDNYKSVTKNQIESIECSTSTSFSEQITTTTTTISGAVAATNDNGNSKYDKDDNDPIYYSLALDSYGNNVTNGNVNGNDTNTSTKSSLTQFPVQIVSMGIPKGNGLVAMKDIAMGTVIFTERAVCAVAVNSSSRTSSSTNHSTGSRGIQSYCGNCFRSMEEIESCQNILSATTRATSTTNTKTTSITPSTRNNKNSTNSSNNSIRSSQQQQQPVDIVQNDTNYRTNESALFTPPNEFPLTYLWPFLPLQFNDDNDDKNNAFSNSTTNNNTQSDDTNDEGDEPIFFNGNSQQRKQQQQQKFLRRDIYGRYQCRLCKQLFCSEYCYNIFESELGNCCILQDINRALPKLLRQPQTPQVVIGSPIVIVASESELETESVASSQQLNNGMTTTMECDNSSSTACITSHTASDTNREEVAVTVAPGNQTHHRIEETKQNELDVIDDVNDVNDDNVQCDVLLAVRMFAYQIQHYRRLINSLPAVTSPTSASTVSSSTNVHDNDKHKSKKINVKNALHGLCGDGRELTVLEIGIGQRPHHPMDECDSHNENSNDNNRTTTSTTITTTVTYTLEPVYKYMIMLWSLTEIEQDVLSYAMFARLAVQAARNGVGIWTQSPFQSYYSALVRTCGGRGTCRYEQVRDQVLAALGVVPVVVSSHVGPDTGSNTGTTTNTTTSASTGLDRGMDKQINERVSVQLAGIFPLTARINHSCSPHSNAEIRSQVFVDYNIDIVSTRNIHAGEEIFISYIQDSHRKSRPRRLRELYAKYLFTCNCPSCHNGIVV